MESIARSQATVALIQHLEDAPLNPLTGTIWPPGHNDLLQARRRLPVYGQYQEILDTYHQSQVMILSSKTGTGKSTQVPQLLVYDEYESGLQIACTQPRKLATKELASRVANEMGVVLGQEVGYKIRNDQKFTKQTTRLTYMTEGVLLRQLGSDKNLSAYACVVLDEAHERTTNLDLLLALLKKIIRHRTDFKLVIMSATLDARLFQDYFDGCPLVHIEGRNFDVEICYASGLGTSFITAAASMVVKIHNDQKPGDILTFLPGEDEIGQVCELVRQHTIDLDVFPLHSSLSASDQMLALSTSGPNRKCIVSTNIAETSLTVDNVIYVVDTGLSRQLIYNPRLRLHMLEIRPISQASARQRAGRAGRTRDGICYRLYSKEAYDSLDASTEPAIRCGPIDSVILKLVALGFKKIFDFDWVDAPNPESIARAANDLLDLRLISDRVMPTIPGYLATQCPVEPIWWRAIIVASKLGCTLNIVDIALLCSSQPSIFLRQSKSREAVDLSRVSFEDPLSDHLTLANAFNAYMQVRQLYEQENGPKFDLAGWCLYHGLNMRALEEVCKSRDNLEDFLRQPIKYLKDINILWTRAPDTDTTRVRRALAIAFCTQTAIHRTGDEYRTVHGNTSALLSSQSSLIQGNHEWIMYDSLHKTTGKQYLQIVTAIDTEWLVASIPYSFLQPNELTVSQKLPFFQDDRLPQKRDGSFRQPNVKLSLDNAKARIETAKK
ncbi:hypothetical protein ACHAPE_006855 [Trichoderma viride]